LANGKSDVNNLPFPWKEYSSHQTCSIAFDALCKAEKSSRSQSERT